MSVVYSQNWADGDASHAFVPGFYGRSPEGTDPTDTVYPEIQAAEAIEFVASVGPSSENAVGVDSSVEDHTTSGIWIEHTDLTMLDGALHFSSYWRATTADWDFHDVEGTICPFMTLLHTTTDIDTGVTLNLSTPASPTIQLQYRTFTGAVSSTGIAASMFSRANSENDWIKVEMEVRPGTVTGTGDTPDAIASDGYFRIYATNITSGGSRTEIYNSGAVALVHNFRAFNSTWRGGYVNANRVAGVMYGYFGMFGQLTNISIDDTESATDPSLRVTQLFALLVQDREPDPGVVGDPTGNGDVGAGTDPNAGLDLCGQPIPVAYIELTPPGSSTTYRYSKVAINRTVQDDPRVDSYGLLTRGLTDRQKSLRGSRMSPVLIDTDRLLRGLEASDSLVNSVVRAYLTTLSGLDAGSTARRVFSGLLIESEPLGGLRMQVHAADYLQVLLERVPMTTYPQRVFNTDDFPNLGNDPDPEGTSPGNPALIGKPVPIGYGILSDESEGADAKGVCPAYFVGRRTVDGYFWDEYVVFGHSPSPGGVLGFFGEINGTRQKFTSDMNGIDVLLPGTAAWNTALGSSNLYRDFNGNRYMVFYARGPRSYYAQQGKIPFSLNVGGVEDVGDGTGDCITSIARQAMHILTNWVLQSYASGAWLSAPTVDSYSRINTQSFEDVRTRSATRMSTTEGHLGAFLLGWEGRTVTLPDLIAQWHDCGIDLGTNKDGQIIASMIDPTAAAVRSVSDVTDTIAASFRARRRRDEIRNTIVYRYARRYVPALPESTPAEGEPLPDRLRQPQVEWESDNNEPTPGSSSVTKYGTRKLDLSLELVRDSATATDVAALKQEVLAPGPVAVTYKEGLCGTNVDLGDNVDLDHFEGLTASGYTDRTLRCEVHTLDLDRFEVEVEGLDVENL